MNRRQVLALLGSAAVGGCLGGGPGSSTIPNTETTTKTAGTASTETTIEPPTETATGTTAEPPEVGEPLPSDCPVFGDHVQRVACYPDTDAPLSMTPSSDAVSLSDASLSFTLSNDTDATFTTNFYAWRLHKRVAGEWYYLAPGMWPEPAMLMRPGASHSWKVTIDNSDLSGAIRDPSSTDDLHLRGLGGGTYAFGIDGWFAGQEYTNKTAAVARFTVEGDPVSLSRTESVESVEREDDTVVVRMPEHDTAETVTVTRVEDPPEDPERVITEQVLRHTPLRNALASFEEGVETVRVENASNRASSVIYVEGQSYVEYDGETYRVTVQDETTTG